MDTSIAFAAACPPVPRPARGRWRGVATVALVLAAALAGGAARADDDPPGRVGRVAQVQGEVRTVNAEGAWVALPRNQPITTGTRVITDKDGRAVLQVGSSTVRLGAYTDLSVTRLDDDVVRLKFDHGQMALRVRSDKIVGEIGVETEEGLWIPHHVGHFRFDRAPNGTLAAQVWSGDMLMQATDSALPVASGQRVEVWREGAQPVTHYRTVPAVADKFAEWAQVEDRVDDRSVADAGATSPLPAEMTGASELSRYGKWSTAADYGSVWTPSGMPAGWAPYQDGTWTWVAPWGWTWVDNAPWGFAPFHYGRWAFVGGHWCWVPGNWGPRPIYAPALVGWFGGEGFTYDGAPAIGWVPLAPNEPFYPAYAVTPIWWNVVNGPIGHPPIRRTIQPVPGHPRLVPVGPISYTNRGAPNAVSVVPAGALGATQPVGALRPAQRADRRHILEQVGEGKVSALPPPAPPAGRGAPGRGATVVQVPATAPATPGAAPAQPAAPAPAPARPATPGRASNRPTSAASASDADLATAAASPAATPTFPTAPRTGLGIAASPPPAGFAARPGGNVGSGLARPGVDPRNAR